MELEDIDRGESCVFLILRRDNMCAYLIYVTVPFRLLLYVCPVISKVFIVVAFRSVLFDPRQMYTYPKIRSNPLDRFRSVE